jgi:hypothetical protein
MSGKIALNAMSAVMTAGFFVSAATADETKKVKLGYGHSVSKSDTIKGDNSLIYQFAGKKGQSLNLNFVPTEGTCGYDLYSPGMAVPMFLGGSGVGAFSGKLPANGDYRVKIRIKHANADDRCRFDVRFKLRG